MTPEKQKQLLRSLLAVIITVALAYFLGTSAGEFMNKRQRESLRVEGINRARQVLERMGTINVGDTLPNYPLEDIDGNLHMLAELTHETTLITYMKPDCEACLVELDALRQTVTDDAQYRYFLFISSANPLHLHKLREQYGVRSYFMYDQDMVIATELRISSYPFNIVVNKDRMIKEINAIQFHDDDLRRIIRENEL